MLEKITLRKNFQILTIRRFLLMRISSIVNDFEVWIDDIKCSGDGSGFFPCRIVDHDVFVQVGEREVNSSHVNAYMHDIVDCLDRNQMLIVH